MQVPVVLHESARSGASLTALDHVFACIFEATKSCSALPRPIMRVPCYLHRRSDCKWQKTAVLLLQLGHFHIVRQSLNSLKTIPAGCDKSFKLMMIKMNINNRF